MEVIIDLPGVCRLMNMSRSTITRMIDRGTFPPPVKINRKNYWFEKEIGHIQKALMSSMSSQGIKQTISEIQDRRSFYREVYDS